MMDGYCGFCHDTPCQCDHSDSPAPERIWAWYNHDLDDAQWCDEPNSDGFEEGYTGPTEYVRADLPAAMTVKPLEWEGHPDSEAYYAFPNDAGDCMYVLDLLDSGRWRLFIGGDLVKDPDDPERVMKWNDPDEAKAYAQEDLDGRLYRLTPAPEQPRYEACYPKTMTDTTLIDDAADAKLDEYQTEAEWQLGV